MSSKKRRGSSSQLGSAPPNQSRFVSEEAAMRYQNVLAGKALLLERGLKPDANRDGDMAVQIAQRNWFDVTEQPSFAVISVVKEFYANAIHASNFIVQVRGQSVSFSRQAINSYFHVPNYVDDATDYLSYGIQNYDLDNLVRRMCKEGTTWTMKRGTNEHVTFAQTALSKYGKAWYSFICSNLMPTTHQAEVTVDRAVLLFALVTDLHIDVGSVICEFITKFLKGKTTGSLPFPSLITGLSRQAGVQWGTDEAIQPPMAAIDHAIIERYQVWPGAISHPRGEGFLRERDSPLEDQCEQPQPPQVHEPSLGSLQAALARIERKVDRQSRRQNRRLDAMAQRMDTLIQFNVQFANVLTQVYSGSGASSSSAPVRFPDPPAPSDYPVDSPDEATDEDA